jgi:hypothetical protein
MDSLNGGEVRWRDSRAFSWDVGWVVAGHGQRTRAGNHPLAADAHLRDDEALAAVLVVDAEVEAGAEKVLVEGGHDVGHDEGAKFWVISVLGGCQRGGDLTRQLHLVLDGAVLVEIPVEAVLVVGCTTPQ